MGRMRAAFSIAKIPTSNVVELNRALVREGWGSEHDAYRQWFTSQFIPEGTAEQSRWFNDLERVSATPEMMERFVIELSEINVTDFLPKVKAPTLATHCKGDVRVPFALGQEIAAGIPGAKFVPLDSRNHVFLADEPASRVFFDAVTSFLGDRPFRGTLPGTTTFKERAQRHIAALERNWLIKTVANLAALAGAVISFLQLFRLLRQ